MTYYAEHREVMLQRAKDNYFANRAKKLAYQKEYDKKRKICGLVKKYPRKSRAKPKPEPKVFLIPIPDEPIPFTQIPKINKPSKASIPFVWKEASFSMTLN